MISSIAPLCTKSCSFRWTRNSQLSISPLRPSVSFNHLESLWCKSPGPSPKINSNRLVCMWTLRYFVPGHFISHSDFPFLLQLFLQCGHPANNNNRFGLPLLSACALPPSSVWYIGVTVGFLIKFRP